jgi:hypothetical protein
MPLDYKILKMFGTTEERIQAVMTADLSKLPADASEEQKEAVKKDVENRKKIEELLSSRIEESLLQSLSSSHLIAAVDLAWDSSTITKRTIPLVMYAQGRIDTEKCVQSLKDLKCSDQYIKNGEGGKKYIDLPKFFDVNINLVRSVITRRVAAQSARYTNLWPFFKYDTRGTSEVDRLRGDLLSQRIDIQADQYGYRDQGVQWIRDMLLYPKCMVFPACKWDREVEYYQVDDTLAEEFRVGESNKKLNIRSRVKREGVPMITPHASRVFWDRAFPAESINTDSGCTWFGFWDIVRYGSILDEPSYYNRNQISYGQKTVDLFNAYGNYFSQYYDVINPPPAPEGVYDTNSAKTPFEFYTASKRDSSTFMTHIYTKMKPNQYGLGDYPFDLWIHWTVADSRTVIHTEIMPDTPGFVFSHNSSSQRKNNLSMAHDLMTFQDQLTNLFSQLCECAKRDLFSLTLLNLDAFPSDNPESIKTLNELRNAMKSGNFQSAMSILEVSLVKMRELNIDLDNVFKVIRQPPNTQIGEIINAIGQTIMMAERVMAMSPQEQAQLSPRETSATEVQVVAGTTENVYQFISDSFDAGRAAMKRYLYNAFMSLATEDVKLPVVERYRVETVKEAGFEPLLDKTNNEKPVMGVTGSKWSLESAEYLFTTRDGAERASNIQSAQTLTQMLGLLMQPPILSKITNSQLCDLINTIIRQSGAGVDVTITPSPGTDNQPVQPDIPQMPSPGSAVTAGPEIANIALPKS